jgi:hypothetical protein
VPAMKTATTVALVLACAAGTLAQRPVRLVLDQDLGIFVDTEGNGRDLKTHLGFETGLVPGDHARVDPDGFLICGRDAANNGVLQHWRRIAGVFVQQSSMALPGTDLVGVAYEPSSDSLFVLDYDTGAIMKTSWDGAHPLAPVWSTWVTPTEVPKLHAQRIYWRLEVVADAGEACTVFVLDHYSSQGLGFSLKQQGARIVEVPLVATQCTSPMLIDWSSVSEAGTTMTVRGSEGMAIEVVASSSGIVIGSATITGGEDSVRVALSEPLAMGGHYHVRAAGTSEVADRIKCPRRYGAPESTNSGFSLRRMPRPIAPMVGNRDFRVRLPFLQVPPPAATSTCEGVMTIAVRDATTDDLVVDHEGNALLLGQLFVAAKGAVMLTDGFLSAKLPIPDDPDLEGAVVLVQFLVPDHDGRELVVRRSEVLGFDIEPAKRGSRSAGDRRQAFLKWAEAMCRNKQAVFDPTLIDRLFRR